MQSEKARLLLYNFSFSYFTMTKVELGNRGRMGSHILLMHEHNMLFKLHIWKGDKANSKFIFCTFQWKAYCLTYREKHACALQGEAS